VNRWRCPGCGYLITWHATDHDDAADPTDPDHLEAE